MKQLGEAASADELEVEAAIRAIADWQGSVVHYAPRAGAIASPSHRAVDSLSWSVTLDGARSFFLKVPCADQKGFIDPEAAFDAARQAAALGVTPQPRQFVAASGAAVFDMLDASWRTARMDDLRRPAILERTVRLKQAIHAMPRLSATWTVFDRIRTLQAMPGAAGLDVAPDAWWMGECIADIEAAIVAAGYDVRPSHGDGLASNVMLGQDGAVLLVDFDEARNADPLYEIGALLNEAFQFESEMRQGLEMFEGAFRQESLNRCRLYAIADDFLWGSWGMLMDAVSKRRGVEFLKYAHWRLLRCRMALRHPRFEEMLRRL